MSVRLKKGSHKVGKKVENKIENKLKNSFDTQQNKIISSLIEVNRIINITDSDAESADENNLNFQKNLQRKFSTNEQIRSLESFTKKKNNNKYQKDDLSSRLNFAKLSSYSPWGKKIIFAIEKSDCQALLTVFTEFAHLGADINAQVKML